MKLSSIQTRQRIAGGFRSAQVSREETKAFDQRAQKTLQACEDMAEFKHEYFEHIMHETADTPAYLVERIDTLMRLGEQARTICGDYERMIERHESFRQSLHAELQKRRLSSSLRQDIADAHEQHSGLLKDLESGKAAEEGTYAMAQSLLKKLEPRLMSFYQSSEFPVFNHVDALMHEEEIAEEYGEGEITLDEAILRSAENDSWKPTMQ